MTITTINKMFDRIPSWKLLSDSEKIKALHNAYLKLIKLKNEETVLNTALDVADQIIPTLNIYKSHQLNLSAYGSDYNTIEGLAHLTDAERMMILNIAQSKISTWRNAQLDQEYEMNSMKEDVIHRTPVYYQPSLTFAQRILVVVDRINTYVPVLNAAASIIVTLSKIKVFEPLLTVSSKMLESFLISNTYGPSLRVSNEIVQDQNLDIIYTPLLTVANAILAGQTLSDIYAPLLLASYNIIVDADYTEEYTYTPTLGVTAIVEGVLIATG